MKDQKKRKDLMADLRALKDEELKVRQQDLAEELFWMTFKRQRGEGENTSNFRKTRKTLARIKTLTGERSAKEKSKGVSS